jgi:ligand-binding sensor domain-containing protein/signal transduction histidine kinase
MIRSLRNYCVIFFLILVSNTIAFCQKIPFRNYLEKNGLPSANVYCIIQDSRGYLWLGTENGLSCFDGVEFKNYSRENGLADNRIHSILEDRKGNIWIGTDKGVVSGLSSAGLMKNNLRNNLHDSGVYSIVEDENGKIWFGTSNGLSCFNGKTFRHFSAADGYHGGKIYTIAIEKKGKLWLGTESGLICYEEGDFIDYSTRDSVLADKPRMLLYDSGGNLWIGTNKGLNRFKNEKLTTYTTQDGLIHDSVTVIMEGAGGNIWIGTWGGFSIFSGETFLNFSTKNGLPNNFIFSIAEDRNGNIWFGTSGGASCLTSLNIKTYTRDHGLPNDTIIDIFQDKKGRYWFGTYEGLSCYSGGSFKNYSMKDGLISEVINDLMEDRRGNLWIATLRGLSVFSSGSFTNYTKRDGLADDLLFELVESRDGTIWIGNNKGLTIFRNGTFSAPPFSMEPTGVAFIMEDTRGTLWFSAGAALYNYTGKQLTSFSKRAGLPDNYIHSICEDSKGKIWIGTEGGLSCFDRGEFTLYSTANSAMVDNACYGIVEDRQGRLWIGHSKGLTCFDGKNFKTYTSERLGLADRTWAPGIMDDLGMLWFGSTEGVTCFSPPPVRTDTMPPPVYITGVKVMEKEVPISEAGRFRYKQNILRFNFVGINFSVPTGVRYKYLLENIDYDWQFTKDRSLFYPFLPPGYYNLKVKAVNADGVESTKTAEYAFNILPPYWRTWWFQGLVVLAVGLLLVLFFHWNVKRTRERGELEARNRQLVMSQRMELMGTLAAGTVHDLKNLMSIIIGYSRMISAKPHSDKEDHQKVEIIKETAATAVQMTKQILSFARPRHHQQNEDVDLRMLLTEIVDTLKITQDNSIQIQWEPPAAPVLFPIHPARFQQLVMNLCVNASQAMPHGGRLRVFLSGLKNKEIILEITDTGTGIKKENLEKIYDPLFTTKRPGEGTGLGLFVVKQIVDEYAGKIEAHSEPGKGTTFVIRFPVKIVKKIS